MAHEGIGPSQAALLGLFVDRPRHGYELYQEFDRGLGRVWSMGKSKLYAQLKQLEAAGLVVGHTEPQPSRPPRKVYSLTPSGEAAFDRWLHQPTPYLRQIRVEFLARLFFFHHLSLAGLDRLVAEQKSVCRAQIERFGRAAAETDDPFRRLVLEFRSSQLESVLSWLDRCLEEL
jgi:DNA-binding PadR family transcriptional regulator